MMDAILKNPNIASVLCGVAAFAVVVLVWKALLDDASLEARLKSVTRRREELKAEINKKPSRRKDLRRLGLMKSVVNWLKLTHSSRFNATRVNLLRAGYRSRDAVTVFLFMKVALAAGASGAGLFFTIVLGLGKIGLGKGVAVSLLLALIGWVLPNVVVKNQKQKREDVLRKAMPDALDLMVICAEAGLSLDSAFERVSREIGGSSPELAEEFGLTAVELGLLPDRSKALQALAERIDLPGVLALVNTLIQTEKFGTPLAQALRVLSSEMRDERMMRAEEKAARLPAVLTVPMIVFILPTLFIVLMGPAAIKVMATMAHAKAHK